MTSNQFFKDFTNFQNEIIIKRFATFSDNFRLFLYHLQYFKTISNIFSQLTTFLDYLQHFNQFITISDNLQHFTTISNIFRQPTIFSVN